MDANELKDLIYSNIELEYTRSGKIEPIVHVSDLYNGCARKYHLAIINNICVNSIDNKLPNGLKLTYKIGQKIESIIVEALRKYLVGGKDIFKNLIYYTAPMMSLTVGKFEIRGHPDVVIEIEDKKYILEIKSIKPEDFDSLKEPIYKHAHQLMSYIYLSKKLRKGYESYGFLVYVSKGHRNDPLKIFEVKLTKRHRELLEAFSKSLASNRLPARICNSKLHLLAKDCQVKEVCFDQG